MGRALYYLKVIFFSLLVLQIGHQVFKKFKKTIENQLDPKNKVGLIVINQVIQGSSAINKRLQKAFKDDEIKAVLLRIDSPGGVAGAGEAISQEIIYLKQKYPKPIVTYVESIAASAAYQIASATDCIVATNSALIGSIGAKFATQFKVKDFLNQYKIQTEEYVSSPYKNVGDPFSITTPEQEQMLQNLVIQAGDLFTQDVARLRHLDIEKRSIWADGKIFIGPKALELKLIDLLGNQRTALDYIKSQILHADYDIELVNFKADSVLKRYFEGSSDGEEDEIQASITQSFWKSLFTYIHDKSVYIA